MASLTTHVLDTAHGKPGSGIRVEFFGLDGGRKLIGEAATNGDGRAAIAGADALAPGIYELQFHAGDYFRRLGVSLPSPAFLDLVVLRFGIAEPTGHYHVPLLLSPWSYSTYRGS